MSETATLTLADFLLTRIAEDEADAVALTRHSDQSWWTAERIEAECEAKRRIVEQAERWAEWIDGQRETDYPHLREAAVLRSLLGPLATVYADHPDYRDEWR